jgi:hypothetical protein
MPVSAMAGTDSPHVAPLIPVLDKPRDLGPRARYFLLLAMISVNASCEQLRPVGFVYTKPMKADYCSRAPLFMFTTCSSRANHGNDIPGPQHVHLDNIGFRPAQRASISHHKLGIRRFDVQQNTGITGRRQTSTERHSLPVCIAADLRLSHIMASVRVDNPCECSRYFPCHLLKFPVCLQAHRKHLRFLRFSQR